jgi:hypothetical protein
MKCIDNWNDESLGGASIDHIRKEVVKSWPNTFDLDLYPVPVGRYKRSPVNVYQSVATLQVWTCAKASKIKLKKSLFIWWWWCGTLNETVKELSVQHFTIPKCLQIIWCWRDLQAIMWIGWKVTFLLFLLPCQLVFCEMKWSDGDPRKVVVCMSKVASEDVTNKATRNCVKHWQKWFDNPAYEQKDSELHMNRTTTSLQNIQPPELWTSEHGLRFFAVF